MKTTRFFNQEERKWLLIDAKDKVLGRLSSRIARILQGKNKPTYTPNFLCGDKVVIINARHIKLTANKSDKKTYAKYSGYPSGHKETSFKIIMEKNPVKALQLSIKGMLPKNHLGAMMYKSLKVYPEGTHDQAAQNPLATEV
ncbi:MAG: 50S ribosomal protein L13 [Candidatus Omnitrophota bacterium]|jgi:large subunit ribosomal protein L13